MARHRICSIPDCGKRVTSHGLCSGHWYRQNRYGDPFAGGTRFGEAAAYVEIAAAFEGDECLQWPFYITYDGYGRVQFRSRGMHAHRAVCIFAHGEPSSPDHEAAHSCDNRACVNPRHIRWATPKENAADRMIHGKRILGETHPRAKLTYDDVRTIRELRGVVPVKELAERFNVSRSAISMVTTGRNWS